MTKQHSLALLAILASCLFQPIQAVKTKEIGAKGWRPTKEWLKSGENFDNRKKQAEVEYDIFVTTKLYRNLKTNKVSKSQERDTLTAVLKNFETRGVDLSAPLTYKKKGKTALLVAAAHAYNAIVDALLQLTKPTDKELDKAIKKAKKHRDRCTETINKLEGAKKPTKFEEDE